MVQSSGVKGMCTLLWWGFCCDKLGHILLYSHLSVVSFSDRQTDRQRIVWPCLVNIDQSSDQSARHVTPVQTEW